MNRFKRILVVVNPHCPQSPALNRAVSLALRNGASVHAIDIVERPPGFIFKLTDTAKKLYEQEFQVRQKHLDTLVAPYRIASGIDITSQTLRGRPPIEAIRQVINGHFDVLLKDVTNSGPNASSCTGIDLRLVRQCPCSVWLVRQDRGGAFDHIAAAIDPQPANESDHRLNVRVLQSAASIAKSENAKLTIISVWQGSDELALMDSLYAGAVVEFEERLKNDAAMSIRETVRQANLTDDYSMVLRRGHPASVISRELKNAGADLIVMGTLARSGIAGLFIGNTVERVVTNVTTSVLTVRTIGSKLTVEAVEPRGAFQAGTAAAAVL